MEHVSTFSVRVNSVVTYNGDHNDWLSNLFRDPRDSGSFISRIGLSTSVINFTATLTGCELTVYPDVKEPPYNQTSTGSDTLLVAAPKGLQMFSVKQSSLSGPWSLAEMQLGPNLSASIVPNDRVSGAA